MIRAAILRRAQATASTQVDPKPCEVCSKLFFKFNSMQRVCGPRCAVKVPVLKRSVERAQEQMRIEGLRPRGWWLKRAQAAFNAWVRARDAAEPCISCGTSGPCAWDAGHYLTTGARPELRFDEDNVHKQCVRCNQHLHGNLILYRAGLIRRRGLAVVERLEGPHDPKKYTIDDLKALIALYRAKAKAITKETQTCSND